ncbi:MAG: hypothetical protein MI802_14550, partial [Desulfobacterales bacterium]|nr:hypothetical protein [Desulfobacterales bacterium]
MLPFLISAIAPKLAQKGLDLLGGLFSSAAEKGADLAKGVVNQQLEKVSQKIEEKTGIKLENVAEDKLTQEEWIKLKEFELQEQELLMTARSKIAEIELEHEKVLAADRADARQAGTQRDQNEDKFVRRFPYIYAYAITGLTFLFIIVAIFLPPFMDSINNKLP